ncbi:LamB/YcsF family protein [Erwiniaceae bacterium BAC15a-03b]|uniref:LamB/YcsF family protein n=1 Tax=Winslowiella arboricola TaxID=2978220 RepID=A0A9J6PMB1_9GAMM|nr:5-oxoprolinase subunit PxpA [Winslowiella arboricola]MCU5772134.1 LamB/YcsF family protein [Winslowiella arboricola]MCU5778530.1 LamB/YcsF family protein [Winslowiella arboricola]
MKYIDLNADIGEGFGDYQIANDAALMPRITSANVACGFHAGDAVIMANTVAMAKENQVDLGAHVGFPDLMGFGRRRMQIEPEVMAHYVTYQLGALSAFAAAARYPLTHMSFHGALGNMVSEDAALAQVLLQAVKHFDPNMIISTMSGNAVERAARELDLPVVCTFLADRAYESNGLLVSRAKPGAVIHDIAQVRARVRQFLSEGTVQTIDGATLTVNASSILVHGDNPESIALVDILREIIAELAIPLLPPSRQLRQHTWESTVL